MYKICLSDTKNSFQNYKYTFKAMEICKILLKVSEKALKPKKVFKIL